MWKGYRGIFVPDKCPFERPHGSAFVFIVTELTGKILNPGRKKIKALPEKNQIEVISSQGIT